MSNAIDIKLTEKKDIRLMTHVVGGYPDMEACAGLVRLMAEAGVDFVEIQIPFSDPLADGPTIMEASQKALDQGTTPAGCMQLAAKLSQEVDIPLLFMTYANVPFAMGLENFVAQSAKAGISGLIVPDLPVDEEEGQEYLDLLEKYSLKHIQVVSPDCEPERLQAVLKHASGFVYTTLKVGITGAGTEIGSQGLNFLSALKEHTKLPIAAGFGISSAEHVATLKGKTDIAVIGSHVLNLLKKEGEDAVEKFLRSCLQN